MKRLSMLFLSALAATCFQIVPPLRAQGAPDIVWEATTPSGLANSIQGVGWSPLDSGRLAFGSTDRWLRTREAENGVLSYSVLQPHRSGGADQTIYSADGKFQRLLRVSGYEWPRFPPEVLPFLEISVSLILVREFRHSTDVLEAISGEELASLVRGWPEES